LKKLILLAVVAAVVLTTLGCISFEKKPEKITTLRIGYQPSTHQITEMLAAEKGWWKEDLKPFGIEEVKEFEFPSGPPEMQAMLAGDLDVAYVGTAPPIAAISPGRQDRSCCQHQRLQPGLQDGQRVPRPHLSGGAEHRHIPARVHPGYSDEEVANGT
jgi:hypothetical protein